MRVDPSPLRAAASPVSDRWPSPATAKETGLGLNLLQTFVKISSFSRLAGPGADSWGSIANANWSDIATQSLQAEHSACSRVRLLNIGLPFSAAARLSVTAVQRIVPQNCLRMTTRHAYRARRELLADCAKHFLSAWRA